MSSPEYAELVGFLGQRFAAIDQRVDQLRTEMLERDLAALREHIAVLAARIADIEQRLRSSS
jgi:hypothetical protein